MPDLKVMFLEEMNTKEVKALSEYDSEVLAAALVFVVSELMITRDPSQIPKLQNLVKKAGILALELTERVNVLSTNSEEETIH